MYPFITVFRYSFETYFVFLSLLFTALVPFVVFRAKKFSLDIEKSLDLYLIVICSAFFGARLFYVFYQEPAFYLQNPMEIFYFWKGGFVFYGGFFGGLLGGLLFLKRLEQDWLKWANFSAPVLSLGYGLGRVSCLLAGCCYGREADTWYSIFIRGAQRHPTQLYAVIFELLVFSSLLFLEKRDYKYIFFLWLFLHGIGRMFMEFFRADPRGDTLFGLSVSTVISLILMAVGAVLIQRGRSGKS